ncbi:hypothetical protein Bca52824_062524 [Brassica carinata]|nr:hypothetical protein Bca52824_062524 [Brassica carinata]
MGEAKVLVEMKLDRDFPKLIALDDKQDSIYLVNVEYTWIPSTCERCGSLSHNAKICLLPRKLPEDSNSLAKSVGVNDDIPVVNIDLILQQEDNVVSSSSTSQQKEASAQVSLPAASLTCGVLNIQNQFKDLDVLPAASVSEVTIITKDVSRSHSGLETETQSLYVSSNTSMDCQDTQVAGYKTISSSSQIQEENQIALPSLPKIFSPLVDSQSAPTSTHIMDSCPSKFISSEDHKFSVVDLLTTTLLASAFESPSRFTVLGNVDETLV